jgi:hypothetical protein
VLLREQPSQEGEILVSTPADDIPELIESHSKAIYIAIYVQFAFPDVYAEAVHMWNTRPVKPAGENG